MPLRLIIAVTLSLVLHGGLLVADAFKPAAPRPRPALQAILRLPPEPARPAETPPIPDSLLKNTIEEEALQEDAPKPPPPVAKKKIETPNTSPPTPKPLTQREIRAVQEKLAEYVFYPEHARALGIEGTVELFIELSANGKVEDVRVVSSSGYPILDNAAIKGFYAIGRLPGTSDTWSYTFQLE